VRSFWKGDAPASALTPRLCASADIFDNQGRRPWASVNFITAHDGFTLNDIVNYNDKHNEANGEDNKDGTSDNRSWNCGVEGPTDDPEINDLRERQIRNMLATLLLSQGTPMLLAGDEFGRTQQGNNNAYCQDNEISWVNWHIEEKGHALIEFVKKLIGLRHRFPILRRNLFLDGKFSEDLGIKDVTWINVNGKEMEGDSWNDAELRCFGMLLDGRAQPTGIRQLGHEATLLIVLNHHHEPAHFTLPECFGGSEWCVLVDTNDPAKSDEGKMKSGAEYEITPRSLLLFALKADPESVTT
jgi:isoamylase